MPSPRDNCPICGNTPTAKQAPFCSQGCRDRDLLRWLGEGYAIPGPSAADRLDSDDDTSL